MQLTLRRKSVDQIRDYLAFRIRVYNSEIQIFVWYKTYNLIVTTGAYGIYLTTYFFDAGTYSE